MNRWDDVGDLRRLTDPESLATLLREGGVPATSAVADHLRLKPGVNALVGVRIGTDTGSLPGYVRTYGDGAQAALVADKWSRMRSEATPLGPAVRLLPGGASVLFVFPHDARVRRLRFLVGRPRRLARLLGQLDAFREGRIDLGGASFETLRYKPERRVVAAAHLPVDAEPRHAVFRLRDDRAGPDLSIINRRLHGALGARVPRPLGALCGGALVVEDQVPGTGLRAAIGGGYDDAEALAEVVAGVHASGIDLPSRIDAPAVLGRALAGLDLLVGVQPTLSAAAQELRSGLAAALPPTRPLTPLHGDLHLDQVILGPPGPVLLDFERAATGPAGHDVGTLVAHLRADGHDAFGAAFLDAYARWRAVVAADLAFFVGCGLVERAVLALRSLRPAWQETVPHLLELAGEELRGRRRWHEAFPRRSGPWPTRTETGGVRHYGRWDPVGRTLVEAEPDDDDALPGLGPLLRDGGSLIAYRPGQRAVVRVERPDGARFVKVVPPRRAARLLRRAVAVERAAAVAPDFPRLAPVIDASPARGTVDFAELAGPALRDLLLAGEGDDALLAVAAALAAFQAVPVPDDVVQGHGSGLEDWVAFVTAHAPALAPAYERARRALPDAPAGASRVLVHGDLHDGNLVVTDAGIGLLDLDGVVAGDPAGDVGNLMAHLVLRALQRGDHDCGRGHDQGERFLAAYQRAGGSATPGAVTAATARALFRLACVHLLRGRWHALSPLLLHEAVGRSRRMLASTAAR